MSFADTIRKIASQARTPEIQRQLEVLAAEFEEQQNRVANNWQRTFSSLENASAEALDAIRYDMQQDAGHREAQERLMREAIAQLRADVDALQARAVGETGDGNG